MLTSASSLEWGTHLVAVFTYGTQTLKISWKRGQLCTETRELLFQKAVFIQKGCQIVLPYMSKQGGNRKTGRKVSGPHPVRQHSLPRAKAGHGRQLSWLTTDLHKWMLVREQIRFLWWELCCLWEQAAGFLLVSGEKAAAKKCFLHLMGKKPTRYIFLIAEVHWRFGRDKMTKIMSQTSTYLCIYVTPIQTVSLALDYSETRTSSTKSSSWEPEALPSAESFSVQNHCISEQSKFEVCCVQAWWVFLSVVHKLL